MLWCGFLLFHSRHSRSTISPIVILHHFSDVSQVITLSFIHPVLLLSLIFLSSEKRELFALIFFDILPIQVYNINEFLFCLYWQNIRCICLRQVHYFFILFSMYRQQNSITKITSIIPIHNVPASIIITVHTAAAASRIRNSSKVYRIFLLSLKLIQ